MTGRPVSSADDDRRNSLSRREIQFIGELAAGRTDQEIADRLSLSVRTVNAHIQAICNKVGVRNRAELIKWWEHFRDAETES